MSCGEMKLTQIFQVLFSVIFSGLPTFASEPRVGYGIGCSGTVHIGLHPV